MFACVFLQGQWPLHPHEDPTPQPCWAVCTLSNSLLIPNSLLLPTVVSGILVTILETIQTSSSLGSLFRMGKE